MNQRKVCVVITARPSYSRIKTALIAINNHPKLELQLVLACSSLLDRYGSVLKVIESDVASVIDATVFTDKSGSPISSQPIFTASSPRLKDILYF